MSEKIDFYFDFVSPYSFLAWQAISADEQLRGLNYSFKPVTLGNIIKSYDTKGPAEIDAKRNYLFKDFLRKINSSEIKFNMPSRLPFNSSYLLRLALSQKRDLIDLLFKACWSEAIDVEDINVLEDYLEKNSFNFQSLDKEASSKDSRRQIKNNVKEAIDLGIFGVPSFIVGQELFWGEDSLKFLKLYLNGQDLVDESLYNKFENDYPIGR